MLDTTERTIETAINYLVDYALDPGKTPFNVAGAPAKKGRLSESPVFTGTPDPRRMIVRNGRPGAGALALDREGFRLARHDTGDVDFLDEEEVRRVYYPEVAARIEAESGARRVVVFDHLLRTSDDKKAVSDNQIAPEGRAHNDYTEWSAPQRVRELLPEEAETLLGRRFALIQMWQPIHHPVETSPLAMCDAQSVSPDDLMVCERHYPDGRIGQTYTLTHNPAHRWYWFPRMECDEALIFKAYDSRTDGCARWTPHVAIDDPSAPPDARPRESIEVRAFAFF